MYIECMHVGFYLNVLLYYNCHEGTNSSSIDIADNLIRVYTTFSFWLLF